MKRYHDIVGDGGSRNLEQVAEPRSIWNSISLLTTISVADVMLRALPTTEIATRLFDGGQQFSPPHFALGYHHFSAPRHYRNPRTRNKSVPRVSGLVRMA